MLNISNDIGSFIRACRYLTRLWVFLDNFKLRSFIAQLNIT